MGHRASTPHLTSIVGRDCPNSAGLNLEAQPTPTASSAMLAASPLSWQHQWDLLSNRGALAPRGWTGACPRSLSPGRGCHGCAVARGAGFTTCPGARRGSGCYRRKAEGGCACGHLAFQMVAVRKGTGQEVWQVWHGAGRSTSAGRGARARSQASLGAQRAVPRWLCREMFSPPPDFPTKLLLFLLQFPWHYLRSPSQCLYTTTLVLSSALCCQHSKNTAETHTAAAAQGSAIGHSYRVLNKV